MSTKERLAKVQERLAKVQEAVESLRRSENDSAMAQGESPRPLDYSEGHYTGHRAGVQYAIRVMDAALATPEDGTS